MAYRFDRACVIAGATAISSLLASCASSPEQQLSEMAFDPSRNALLVLETSDFNLGISGTDPFVLQQYDPASGKPGLAQTSLEIVGSGGRFVVAQAPAGFHVVQAHQGLDGRLCYDVQSYGVKAAPGQVVLIGKLDLAKTQKEALTLEQAFTRSEPVPKDSPQARDRVLFELTRNFGVIDQVAIKREMFNRANETPFAGFAAQEHTYRVTRTPFLTSLGPPSLTRVTDESLAAAKTFIASRRPELAGQVAIAELQPVRLAPGSETCAAGSVITQ